jgi:hypothetical protein
MTAKSDQDLDPNKSALFLAYLIWIRNEVKSWIQNQIRNKTNEDPQHWVFKGSRRLLTNVRGRRDSECRERWWEEQRSYYLTCSCPSGCSFS